MSPPAEPVLALEDLGVALEGGDRRRAVDGLSLELGVGETLCLVGESGCGKSLTGLAALGLLPEGVARTAGTVRYHGRDLGAADERAWRALRGQSVAMIFQEPMTSLNPVMPVGRQVAEPLRTHWGYGRRAARHRARELLEQVGLPDARHRLDAYPDELSGGQRQRVMIAAALACDPDVLIADEPTTALDVTIQAVILELLAGLRRERGMGLLFITHDLGVAEAVADRVAVMYAGELVEMGPAGTVLAHPRHPYTAALLAAVPGQGERGAPLQALPGGVPEPGQWGTGCRFAERCPVAEARCTRESVALVGEGGHHYRCLFPERAAGMVPA
jgi:oligopeptide/dipeptide ABC transporter ATP-binding protein